MASYPDVSGQIDPAIDNTSTQSATASAQEEAAGLAQSTKASAVREHS